MRLRKFYQYKNYAFGANKCAGNGGIDGNEGVLEIIDGIVGKGFG